MRRSYLIVLALMLPLLAIGCANNKDLLAQKDQEIGDLQSKVSSLEGQLTQEKKRAEDLNSELNKALSDYKQKEQVLLERIDNKSVITVSDAVLFTSGGVVLTQNGTEMIDKIVEIVKGYPDREIRVEGHTDNVGIALEFQDRFKSNWELSTARATSVVHYLRQKHDMDPNRLAAVGFGEYRPLGDNATPEGRSQNRRVVIEVGPKQ